MFKVVPDQLRVSEGWVRCGKFEEIFDASAHLVESAAEPVPAPGDGGPDTVPFQGALAAAMAAEPPASRARPGDEEPPRTEPLLPAAAPLDFELKDPNTDPGLVLEPAVPSGHAPLLADGPAQGAAPAGGAGAAADARDTEPVAELSFMRKARKSSRWHRPLVRATLMVVGLLLVLGLGLQVLVHERDRVAAVEPGLRPMLSELCLLLDCRVGPLRQIESVVIDSSAFSKSKADVYRLSLTLKNTAPIDLAMPAVELSLTDTLDHPLLRRVFRPEELGVRSGVIPAASEIQSTLVLNVKTNGNGERIAGYRLLAFYP
jgi:hypothetical protein